MIHSVDPNGIFAFMVSQLQAAEDAGQRAWIIGHIPAGKADIFHDQVRLVQTITVPFNSCVSMKQSNYYDQIVQRYVNTIAAQFFGHSHKVAVVDTVSSNSRLRHYLPGPV